MAQTHYTAFTVQSGQVPSTLTAFPVLIMGNDARFKSVANLGHVFRSDGGDFRAYADTGLTTTYNYELVSYDPAAGTFEMWVQVTILTSTTPIYIGYGDTALTSASTSSTWDTDYTGVWHLKDGSTLAVTDSSQEVDNGTNSGATATTGKVNGGAAFVTGSSQSIVIPGTDDIASDSTFTMALWFKSSDTANVGGLYCEGSDGSDSPLLYIVTNTPTAGDISVSNRDNSTNASNITAAGSYTDNVWHYLVLKRTSTSHLELFIDNTSVGSDTTVLPDTITVNKIRLGALERSSVIFYYTGSLDEVQRSKIARSADWCTAAYNNENAPGTFYSVGTEVPTGGGGGTTRGTAFGSGGTAFNGGRTFQGILD